MQSRRNSKHSTSVTKSELLKTHENFVWRMGKGSVILNFRYSGDRMKDFHYAVIRLNKIR